MESFKLGDDGLENPLAITDVILDNYFASKNEDDMFTNIFASKDDGLLYYDDVMPPIYDDCDEDKVVVYDNYCDDTYAIRKNYNHLYERNYSLTEHHLPNIQLVYCVQVFYDSPTSTITNEKDYAYVESNKFSMLVDHDKNALCDTYIVEFIHYATESYYDRKRDMVSLVPIILSFLSSC